MDDKLPVLGFQIIRILDCGFFVEELIKVDFENAQIGYAMNFSFSIEDSWIEFLIRVDLKEKISNATFLSGTVLTKFGINNLANFLNEDNKFDFPSGSLEVLFGIAFGHLRAIVAKNSAGSRFRDFIIPPINQVALFNELLEANIERMKQANTSVNQEIKEPKQKNKKKKQN